MRFLNLFLVALVVIVSTSVYAEEVKKEAKPQTIQDKLDAKSKAFAEKADEETKKAYEQGLNEIRETAITERALKKGDVVPDFGLTAPDGTPYSLLEVLNKGPVVLTWYRGGWCPYCNIYLKGLRGAKEEVNSLGATIIAISPEKPEKMTETIESNDLSFVVLSDEDNSIARKFNIVFKVPEVILEKWKGKIDLTEYNGNDKNELPLSATYVIGKDAQIVYSFLDVDYKKRADPTEIIQVLKNISAKEETEKKKEVELLQKSGQANI